MTALDLLPRARIVSLVLKRMAKLLVVAALASSIGLHWAVLQSVAWTAMLADNLRASSLAQAVQQTFDGRHPCSLCKAIAKAKNAERKNDSSLALKKFEFPPAPPRLALLAPAAFPVLRSGDFPAALRFSAPPSPPPRSSLA